MSEDYLLDVGAYWEQHKTDIKEFRKWADVTVGGQSTLTKYNAAMEKLMPFLPSTPICELHTKDLLNAVEQPRKKDGSPYAPSTIKTFMSILKDILKYASDRGDATNDPLCLTPEERNILRRLDYSLPQNVRYERVQFLLKKYRNRQRSLDAKQQLALIKLVLENITVDGRFLGIAIMFYIGLRPSECRGLLWGDLIPFIDHPDRYMLVIDRERNRRGDLIDRVKRPASYRKVGIQVELAEIIRMRYTYMQQTLPEGTDFSSYPLCCYGNDFQRPCRPQHLSSLATELIKKARIPQSLLEMCSLDMWAYEPSLSEEADEDLHVTTYLLRHNFFTWLQGATTLTADEKAYYMGHAIYNNGKDIRPTFNYEDWLYQMLLKLDHDIKCPSLRRAYLQTIITGDCSVSVGERGIYDITLTPEILQRGGTLRLSLQAKEVGDTIRIIPQTGSHRMYSSDTPLEMNVRITPHDPLPCESTPIVCDYHLLKHLSTLRAVHIDDDHIGKDAIEGETHPEADET